MPKKARTPHPVYATPHPIQVWEWALVYPAFWLISYVIGPIVERLPWGWRSYPKNTYRGL